MQRKLGIPSTHIPFWLLATVKQETTQRNKDNDKDLIIEAPVCPPTAVSNVIIGRTLLQ